MRFNQCAYKLFCQIGQRERCKTGCTRYVWTRGKSRHRHTAPGCRSEVNKSMSSSAAFHRFQNGGRVKCVMKEVGRVLRHTNLLNQSIKNCPRLPVARRLL